MRKYAICLCCILLLSLTAHMTNVLAADAPSRSWIGVNIGDIEQGEAKVFGLDRTRVMVVEVNPEGPADKAGIRRGDIILSFDGKAIADANAMVSTITAKSPGEKLTITVWRNGESHTLTVTLGERPSQEKLEFAQVQQAANQGNTDAQFALGMLYFQGLGVPKDEARAVEWFKKAAEKGHANAQKELTKVKEGQTASTVSAASSTPTTSGKPHLNDTDAKNTPADTSTRWEWLKETAGAAVEAIKEATPTAETIKETAEATAKATKEVAGATVEAIKEAAPSAETIKETAEATAKATAEAAKKTVEMSTEMFETSVHSMGAYAPVLVVLLRDHSIDGVFTILESIPLVSNLTKAGKTIFRGAIEIAVAILHEKGEPYLMNMIAEIWQKKGPTLDVLREDIDKINSAVMPISARVKKEALHLINTYHLDAKKKQ